MLLENAAAAVSSLAPLPLLLQKWLSSLSSACCPAQPAEPVAPGIATSWLEACPANALSDVIFPLSAEEGFVNRILYTDAVSESGGR